MSATLGMINLNQIDKTDWEPIAFEKITHRISETVDPTTTSLEVYVGLEHIDAEDVHIRRFGSPNDVTGGKLKCYPGDVIFGKRRAYQRKAAIVEFEGICSAHAFVFRANTDVIDSKLFPFFLHSDQFMHRMVDISVGGLSPTINWGDLKGQEFLLPPKAEQTRLAELLWAMDDVIEKEKKVLRLLRLNRASIIKKSFKEATESLKISQLGRVITGNTPSTKVEEYWGGQTPFITPAEITDSPFVNRTERYLTELGKSQSRIYPANSILTVCIGSTIGKVAINEVESCSNQQINALIPYKNYNSIYLLYLLRFHKPKIIARTGSTAVPIINKSEFSSIRLPVLSESERKGFVVKIVEIDKLISLNKFNISNSQALQKSLINQIF